MTGWHGGMCSQTELGSTPASIEAMNHQPGIRSRHFIDHETIGQPRRDVKHLESLLCSADWRVVIQNVSFLSTVESRSRMFEGEPYDDTVARRFMDCRLSSRVLQEIEQGGVLVNKFALALIACKALLVGQKNDGDGKLASRETLGELLLTANDIATEPSGNASHWPDLSIAKVSQSH